MWKHLTVTNSCETYTHGSHRSGYLDLQGQGHSMLSIFFCMDYQQNQTFSGRNLPSIWFAAISNIAQCYNQYPILVSIDIESHQSPVQPYILPSHSYLQLQITFNLPRCKVNHYDINSRLTLWITSHFLSSFTMMPSLSYRISDLRWSSVNSILSGCLHWE